MKAKRRTRAMFKAIMYLNSKMPYGKHKGKTVQQVLNTDSPYLVWWHENVEDYPLETSTYTQAYANKAAIDEANQDDDESSDFNMFMDDFRC